MEKKVKVKSLSRVPTLCDPVDCSLPGFSVHGILQARVLEWVAISFSRGSSRPRDQTLVSCIAGRRFNLWATREALMEKNLYLYKYVYIIESLCCTPQINTLWIKYISRKILQNQLTAQQREKKKWCSGWGARKEKNHWFKNTLCSVAQLDTIPWTVAHQAPLSMGLSREESWYWSGLPFPYLGWGSSGERRKTPDKIQIKNKVSVILLLYYWGQMHQTNLLTVEQSM